VLSEHQYPLTPRDIGLPWPTGAGEPAVHPQFLAIDNTARFDVQGVQINQQFGKATSARNPRIMQGATRFTF
jgi:hypothetical protein